MTNKRQVFRSRDQSEPIRGQYSGHVISLDQSEASILTWLRDQGAPELLAAASVVDGVVDQVGALPSIHISLDQ